MAQAILCIFLELPEEEDGWGGGTRILYSVHSIHTLYYAHILVPCYSECVPWASNMSTSIAWELVSEAASQSLPCLYWVSICILVDLYMGLPTSPPPPAILSWEHRGWGTRVQGCPAVSLRCLLGVLAQDPRKVGQVPGRGHQGAPATRETGKREGAVEGVRVRREGKEI